MSPPEGVWLATDLELTNMNTGESLTSHAQKQLLVIAYDGHALMGLTGVAWTPSGHNIMDWLATYLAQGRSVGSGASVIPADPRSIRNELERILGHLDRSFRRWGWDNYELRIVGAGYETGQPFWFAISNADRAGRLYGRFDLIREPIHAQGGIVDIDGSGRAHYPQGRLLDLINRVQHRPRDPRDYMMLLASEVEYVGDRARDVSSWSQVTYMPPDVFPLMGKGFSRMGAEINRTEEPLTIVMHATQISAIIGDGLKRERQGKSITGYEWQFGPTGSQLLADSSELDRRPMSRRQRRERTRRIREFRSAQQDRQRGGDS